jgi:hypothetical protein
MALFGQVTHVVWLAWPHHMGWASKVVLAHMPRFGLNPFPFSRIDSNFGNSYLFDYCSKIHKTNSLRFLISISTHKNIKMNNSIGIK